MNRNLLIVGAGVYGIVASEIAADVGCFDKIGFVDDALQTTPNGIPVVGKVSDIERLGCQYNHIIVAIGNPEVRLSLIRKIEEETTFSIATLVSPKAYVSPSAQIMKGSIVEPMEVIHAGSVIAVGCIISAGAVVNHASMCCDCVHVDCNATVAGMTLVPAGTKIKSGEVYDRKTVDANDLFFNPEEWARKINEIKENTHPHTPIAIDGQTYNFDEVM